MQIQQKQGRLCKLNPSDYINRSYIARKCPILYRNRSAAPRRGSENARNPGDRLHDPTDGTPHDPTGSRPAIHPAGFGRRPKAQRITVSIVAIPFEKALRSSFSILPACASASSILRDHPPPWPIPSHRFDKAQKDGRRVPESDAPSASPCEPNQKPRNRAKRAARLAQPLRRPSLIPTSPTPSRQGRHVATRPLRAPTGLAPGMQRPLLRAAEPAHRTRPPNEPSRRRTAPAPEAGAAIRDRGPAQIAQASATKNRRGKRNITSPFSRTG